MLVGIPPGIFRKSRDQSGSAQFSTFQVGKFAVRRSLYLHLGEVELEAIEVRSQSLPIPDRELWGRGTTRALMH